ncbi:hypothetical protein [Rosettibacter firmus]|uniref:hypothetical protein n=1 Tax=Rosettibacter firmus TaxID=3111522 RepID=UPI00336BCB1D
MNKKSADMYQGGYNLLGENLYNCHNEKKIIELIENQKNIYSIEKQWEEEIDLSITPL